jgi:hypothetical protein
MHGNHDDAKVMIGGEEKGLSKEQFDSLIEMLDAYNKSKWLGRLIVKVAVATGGLVLALSQFKAHLISLFRG